VKYCPECKTGFPETTEYCPTHRTLLNEIIDLKPGMLIRNSYQIVRKLGEGGMGAVYMARQILMDEPRAIKFLARQWARDEGFTDRFRREARMLRQVRHRNVVDSGDLELAEDGSLFFSMEFVDGPDLRDLINSEPKPFPVDRALALVRGVAEGLGAAHAKGLVHRDIKPENILLAVEELNQGNYRWAPKIADFGVVATKESSATRTRTGASLLTWAYAAPEQWRGMRSAELDGRTDLYALGGVLFELLIGRTAFDAESYEGWAEQHKIVEPELPSALRPELGKWQGLDALVFRLLAKDRGQRPNDVAELLRLLDAIVSTPQARLITVREETTPEPDRKPERVDPHPVAVSDPVPEPDRKSSEDEAGPWERFDPNKHIRLTRGLWIRKVPAGSLVLVAILVIGAVALLLYTDLSSTGSGSNSTTGSPSAPVESSPVQQAAPPPAPSPYGNLSGTVTDQTGATISDVEMSVTTKASDFQHTMHSDQSGRFSLRGLPKGEYIVHASAQGFRNLVYNRVEIESGKSKHLNMIMSVGADSETIEINVKQ
jgi:serine/threonine protein kinase